MGYDRERLSDIRRLIDAPNSDFLICWPMSASNWPLWSAQSAFRARKRRDEEEMREFISYVLQSYEMQGMRELDPTMLGDFLRIRYGGTIDAKRRLGSVADIRGAFIDIQRHLFQ